METFTKPKNIVENRQYVKDRETTLSLFDPGTIDDPIADLIGGFMSLPHCFTLQSCYGHFLCKPEQNNSCLDRLPAKGSGRVKYRIAYVAFCIENSPRGSAFLGALSRLPDIDPAVVQFGSAEWFWKRYLNSYVLQVAPERHMDKDHFLVPHSEALHLQHIRDLFFRNLETLLTKE